MNIAAVIDSAIPFVGGVIGLALAANTAKKAAAENSKKSTARIWAAVGAFLFLYGGFQLSRAVMGPSEAEHQTELNNALAAQAARLNATAPIRVAPGLVLDHASAKDMTFVYVYRFIDTAASQIDGRA